MEYEHINSKGVSYIIKGEEIKHLIQVLGTYNVKKDDLKKLDEIFRNLETKTTMDDLIRNPQYPDWEIDDVLVTRIQWTGWGESYKRKEFKDLIQKNIERYIKALHGILKIIENSLLKKDQYV